MTETKIMATLPIIRTSARFFSIYKPLSACQPKLDLTKRTIPPKKYAVDPCDTQKILSALPEKSFARPAITPKTRFSKLTMNTAADLNILPPGTGVQITEVYLMAPARP